MVNRYLRIRPDKSLRLAMKKALADGKLTFDDVTNILDAALDYDRVTDREYRDLKRFVRKESALGYLAVKIEFWLSHHYPLTPLPVYPHGDVYQLVGRKPIGTHQCAAIVQYSQRAGKARTWREGDKVRGNLSLAKGTPIATFVDGFYPNRNHDNHVAYYHSQTPKEVYVIDQWTGEKKIHIRPLPFLGTHPSGLYKRPSNNGDAMSVIARKKG